MLRFSQDFVRRINSSIPQRLISSSRFILGAQTSISNVMATGEIPTIDHLMSVERATKLMAEKHVDALPVLENSKIIGLFTEHDYFDKVLSRKNRQTATVGEIARMGSDLIVAHPEDTVEGCLKVMTKKNLNTLPVIEHDGHVVGTVSMADLTKEYLAEDTSSVKNILFSEPTDFPENSEAILDELTTSDETSARVRELLDELKGEFHERTSKMGEKIAEGDKRLQFLDPVLEEKAAYAFSESAAFPEFTPAEDKLLEQTQDKLRTINMKAHDAAHQKADIQEEVLTEAQAKLLNEMDYFSEGSDFPESTVIDEAIQVRS